MGKGGQNNVSGPVSGTGKSGRKVSLEELGKHNVPGDGE
jgi:hypothetical protein